MPRPGRIQKSVRHIIGGIKNTIRTSEHMLNLESDIRTRHEVIRGDQGGGSWRIIQQIGGDDRGGIHPILEEFKA